jgi:hypothetical protein
MSSLWTPEGERPVGNADVTPPPTPASETEATFDPEAEARYREEMEHLEEELLNAPVSDVIANHCYGIFQLAAMHLGQQPPNLHEAKLAIDALGAIIDTLGARLGDSEATLTEGLAQIRIAFVQISAAHDAPED